MVFDTWFTTEEGDYAGDNVTGIERANVATEQGWRSGSNQGQREAASMLGLSVDETARRMLEMTMAINKQFFPDHKPKAGESVLGRVTCYTCHQGEATPKLPPGSD